MTEQDKQLLLKDLCARLPYNTIVRIYTEGTSYSKFHDEELENIDCDYVNGWTISIVKPYLRPMSSMTEEEREEWADLFNLELDKLNEIDDENKAEELAPYYFGKSHQVSIDWLNTHHFDYRGLIPMGLAIEAEEGMYKTK